MMNVRWFLTKIFHLDRHPQRRKYFVMISVTGKLPRMHFVNKLLLVDRACCCWRLIGRESNVSRPISDLYTRVSSTYAHPNTPQLVSHSERLNTERLKQALPRRLMLICGFLLSFHERKRPKHRNTGILRVVKHTLVQIKDCHSAVRTVTVFYLLFHWSPWDR